MRNYFFIVLSGLDVEDLFNLFLCVSFGWISRCRTHVKNLKSKLTLYPDFIAFGRKMTKTNIDTKASNNNKTTLKFIIEFSSL